jgi:probable rRNA maturation factor
MHIKNRIDMSQLTIDIQRANSGDCYTPGDDLFQQWISACITDDQETEVSIRIVDDEEMIELNNTYRQKNKTTNVLSFPADFPEELQIPLLGDIVICARVVAEEAREQEKSLEAHWAHMTIHGMLHLLGYDHIDDDEAAEMEALETKLLLALHYPSPYEAEDN